MKHNKKSYIVFYSNGASNGFTLTVDNRYNDPQYEEVDLTCIEDTVEKYLDENPDVQYATICEEITVTVKTIYNKNLK